VQFSQLPTLEKGGRSEAKTNPKNFYIFQKNHFHSNLNKNSNFFFQTFIKSFQKLNPYHKSFGNQVEEGV
jgi:hypothetical protein